MTLLMIEAEHLVAHLVGDYLLQSDWMASEKTKKSLAAALHALAYTLPFLVLSDGSWLALLAIAATHFVIDRWRLARYVVWLKNFMSPPRTMLPARDPVFGSPEVRATWWYSFDQCAATGYPADKPAWLSVWLLIVADNTLHLLCNALALQWL